MEAAMIAALVLLSISVAIAISALTLLRDSSAEDTGDSMDDRVFDV
jgi:hypothetical protein